MNDTNEMENLFFEIDIKKIDLGKVIKTGLLVAINKLIINYFFNRVVILI